MSNSLEMFRREDRTVVFIDGSNLYYTARLLNINIDFLKMLDLFKNSCRLLRMNYYSAVPDASVESPVRRMLDWLDYNGYHLITKPSKDYVDDVGRSRIKGNVDVEIAVGMMNACEYADHAVLISGDGDFRALVEAVQARGMKVTVISSIKTSPPIASDELRRQADLFIDLNDMKDILRYSGPAESMPE